MGPDTQAEFVAQRQPLHVRECVYEMLGPPGCEEIQDALNSYTKFRGSVVRLVTWGTLQRVEIGNRVMHTTIHRLRRFPLS